MRRISLATRLLLLGSLIVSGCAVSKPMARLDGLRPVEAIAQAQLQAPAQSRFRAPADDRENARAPRTPRGQVGVASFYGGSFHGRPTANGETFDETKLTAAHRTLEFGTRVRVTNLENRKSVVVTVNDRGPYIGGRVIDLSRRAARVLGFVEDGTTHVRVQPL